MSFGSNPSSNVRFRSLARPPFAEASDDPTKWVGNPQSASTEARHSGERPWFPPRAGSQGGDSMHIDTVLSVPSRKAIHDAVGVHAGAHLREIARLCALPLGTTLYHLDCLERTGLVVARRDGRYKRYFAAAGGVGRREKEVLSILRHDAPRRIVMALLPGAPLTQRELCAAIRVSRSTLSFHVNRLVAEGVAERIDLRPESRYRLREPDLVRGLLDRYQDSLAPREPATVTLVPDAPAPLAVG